MRLRLLSLALLSLFLATGCVSMREQFLKDRGVLKAKLPPLKVDVDASEYSFPTNSITPQDPISRMLVRQETMRERRRVAEALQAISRHEATEGSVPARFRVVQELSGVRFFPFTFPCFAVLFLLGCPAKQFAEVDFELQVGDRLYPLVRGRSEEWVTIFELGPKSFSKAILSALDVALHVDPVTLEPGQEPCRTAPRLQGAR